VSGRWVRGLAGVVAAGLAGCSLVKLSDDIVQGHCQRDADCAELNADEERASDFDPCRRWQCNAEEKLCRHVALDADHDAQTPGTVMHRGKAVTCQRDAQKQDCKDDDELVGAGFAELCDEHDNDCDGLADEGALEASSTRVVVFDGPTRAGASDAAAATDAAYARDPMSGEIALAYGVLQNESARPGASLLEPGLMASVSPATLAVANVAMALGQEVAIAPLDSLQFAYALVTTSGVPRVIAGVWRSSANQIGVQRELAIGGVACTKDESCSEVLAPAIATQNRDVLVAYLRAGAGAQDPAAARCGQWREEDTPADVLANLLARPMGAGVDEHLEELSASALRIGSSSDPSGPVLLGLPAIMGVPASWLVAYADANGDVGIDRMQRSGTTLEIAQPGFIRLGDGAQPRSAISLVVGPADEEGQILLGIAHQRGCGSGARIVLDVRRLTANGGKLTADTVIDSVQVGGASNESNPALAYSTARDAWLVSYRDLTGLRARVVAADGELHDDQPYSLIARLQPAEGDEVDILPLTSAAFEQGDGFSTIAHVLRAGEDDPRAFEAVHLSCE
jgi:hypothetical protein